MAAKLYRPHIPLRVRCLVAMRQLEWSEPEERIRKLKGKLGGVLTSLSLRLAEKFQCRVDDLRLDHDPPLALRRKRLDYKQIRNSFHSQEITKYFPDANDPNHLFYRPHGAEFAGSHDVKTRIRGDHGQYSDIALIKRERRRQRRASEKPKKKRSVLRSAKRWPKRKFERRKK